MNFISSIKERNIYFTMCNKNNKKKVLFLTNIPAPYRINFYNELSEFVDLTVIFEARRVKGISFNWNDNDIKFKAIFLNNGEIQEKKINWNILKYIEEKEYDFYFVTNYAYYTELAALIKIKFLKIPYVLELDGFLDRKENIIKKIAKGILIRGAKAYFSPSKLSDKVLKNYGISTSRIRRYSFSSLKEADIREALPSSEEKKKLRKELGINEEKVILCVGQFIRRKGNDILIRAARMISKKIGIYFVGGNVTEEYKQLIEEYNLDNVYFIKFQNDETLRKYYDAADLFVLATREDVWGLVINEAMARGLPIITTDKCVAGLELVGENGAIVPVEDERILAENINKIIYNDSLLNTMGKYSLMKIKKYTIEEMTRQHIKYFME